VPDAPIGEKAGNAVYVVLEGVEAAKVKGTLLVVGLDNIRAVCFSDNAGKARTRSQFEERFAPNFDVMLGEVLRQSDGRFPKKQAIREMLHSNGGVEQCVLIRDGRDAPSAFANGKIQIG